jgi:WD40 repeat protein
MTHAQHILGPNLIYASSGTVFSRDSRAPRKSPSLCVSTRFPVSSHTPIPRRSPYNTQCRRAHRVFKGLSLPVSILCSLSLFGDSLQHPDPPGQTTLFYSPDGKYLYTAGANNFIRKYTTASKDEPATIDTAAENNTGIVASVAPLVPCYFPSCN